MGKETDAKANLFDKLKQSVKARKKMLAQTLKKIERHIFRYCWIYILIFPLVLGGIYALPFPQIIMLEANELLTYYGVAFGLLGSYYKYSEDKRKEKHERIKNAMPFFDVKVEQYKSNTKLLTICLQLINDRSIFDIYLYDEPLCNYLKPNTKKKVLVGFDLSEEEKSNADCLNITMERDILDSDGYPKYIQIICGDTENFNWVCEFEKFKIGDKVEYRPMIPWIA